MNTPPMSAKSRPKPPDQYFAADLVQGIEHAAKQRADATPEPEFATDASEQNYKYVCEHLSRHFDRHQLQQLRKRISDPMYWECEARCYEDAVVSRLGHVLDERLHRHPVTPATTEDWQSVIRSHRDSLRNHGFSMHAIDNLRFNITSQFYWEIEAELLEPESSRQEAMLMLQWKEEADKKTDRVMTEKQRTMHRHLGAAYQDANCDTASIHISIGLFPAYLLGPLGRVEVKTWSQDMDETNPTLDLAGVVLFLGSFTGVDDIVSLSDNERYHFSPPATAGAGWKGRKLTQEPKGPFLCLTFGRHLFSPEGWVFGSSSDPDICDVQLAKDNSTGISRRHFRIDTEPRTGSPRITVLSRSGVVRLVDQGRVLSLERDKSTEISRMVTLDLGAVSFVVWRPELTEAEQRRYAAQALKWSKEVVAAIATYIPPLNSQPETVTSNVRYGKNNAVYVNEGGVEGRGMTASVMRIYERTSGLVYGAKEPYYKVSDDFGKVRSRWEELKREFDNIAKLDHGIELVMAADKRLPPWLIMEYIPQSLQPRGFDEQGVVDVLIQISSALIHMHAEGISHRDVKPDNILVLGSRPMHVKLADFGTARQIAYGCMDTFTGSPIYMAPEFLNRSLSYTNKVDMFSLGLVGLQCLTSWDPQSDKYWSRGPLSRRDHQGWMRDVIVRQVDTAPLQFRVWLRKMLRRQPEKRGSARKSLRLLLQIQQSLHQETLNLGNAEIPVAGEDAHIQACYGPGDKDVVTRNNKRPASMFSDGSSRSYRKQKQPPQTHQPSQGSVQGGPDSPQPQDSSFVMPSSPYSAPTPYEGKETLEESEESGCEDVEDLAHDWLGNTESEDSE
ncbi:uncharacterized protein FIESC28_11619 [Fusarium coffeatum]|uniref:Autophagy-related protein 1 n=1 Tax=Fusarium coffeatum TaxID=231269 RepID=A0A366QJY7_9HYPO|nr:uncharacterized protein FIESC28_11619 [Fusarium coffeatum]RBR04170.1 hypothetical protein FIESC28_11619 [Fusarium coffeatum]